MRGRLFPPQGDAVMVDVNVAGQDLSMTGEGVSVRWPLDALEVKLGGDGSGHLVLTHRATSPSADLYVERAGLVAELDAQGAPPWFVDQVRALIGAHRRRWALSRSVVLGVVAALLLAVGLLLANARALALRAVPPDLETAAGRAMFDALGAELDLSADPALQTFVEQTGRRLLAARPDAPYEFRFHVERSPEVNAYALPGGDLIITTGLIAAAGSPDEVAAVIGHEVGHVLERHSLKRVIDGVGLFTAVVLVFDPSTLRSARVLYKLADLVQMKFSRDEEREADRIGLDLVHRAGLDVMAASRFFARLAELEGPASAAVGLSSTHPASAERAQDLARRAALLPATPQVPLLTPEQWADLQARAR